ncbi:MAG: DUF1003 domain-containing protein [Bacteroidota bacterium]
MKADKINKELETESEYLKKLHRIIKASLKEEELLVTNLQKDDIEILTRGQKLSDRVARFGGSWGFIISFFIMLIIWIIYNSTAGTSAAFDPYPFILMNLILSCIAALQAPIIMMSQNRLEEKDRKRAENDYMINLKSEIEIRSLHQKIDLLLEKEITTLFKIQSQQLELLNDICTRMNKEGRN